MTVEDEPRALALVLALAAALYLLSWLVAGPPYGPPSDPSAPVDAGPASDRPPTLAGPAPGPSG